MLIKGVTLDVSHEFQFNTVISKYREFVNTLYDYVAKHEAFSDEDKQVFSFAVVTLIKLMSPVTVHMSEELFSGLGSQKSVHLTDWPKYDDNLAKNSSITLVVQVNGKLKDKIEADAEASKQELEQIAMQSEKIKELIAGKQVVKVIVVPSKLVNIVVK